MSRGGARPGAGRKVGSATKRTREIADQAAEEGITPLEFLLKVMRDSAEDGAKRLDAAKAAAPYVHPRLSNIEAKVAADVNATITRIELVAPSLHDDGPG